MAKIGCLLLDGSVWDTPDTLCRDLHQLRDLLGPEPPIDVRWKGEPVSDLPAGVRLVVRGSGARALAGAAARVTTSAGHLLVLLGHVLPDSAVIQGLLAAFDLDPLVGFAQPRFSDASGEGVWSLPGGVGTEPVLLPRRSLSALPDHYLTTERLAACLALRREAVVGFSTTPDSVEELPAALARELCLARRRGFRNLVLNRVVTSSGDEHAALYPSLEPLARAALEAQFPDSRTAEEWFAGAIHQRFEPVAAKARRDRAGGRLPVLLDCRGAQAYHNGTSQAVFGLLDGIREAEPSWDVGLLFGTEAAEYHGVTRRCAGMDVITSMPDAAYAAAVRLDQPWHLSTVAELHRRACTVSFNILDTISWDVVYTGSADIEPAWRFIAEKADGLLYNSEFTKRRFEFRFPVAREVVQTVTHHGIDQAVRADTTARTPGGDHLLVFGNEYDHKAVAPTIDVLCRAFPYRQIRAIGPKPQPRHNVSAALSGRLPATEIDRLMATAQVVIFPSWYEGFGLPVVKALAYGRTVVVRASPLWREIAGIASGPGKLVEFLAPHDLVEVVGKVLAGEALEGLALGAALTGEPPSWRDCAKLLIAHVERTAASFDARRWYAREHALARVVT